MSLSICGSTLSPSKSGSSDSFSEYFEYLTKQRKLSDHKYNIIFFYLCVFSSLNDAIHISKDSGLTMGMAVCFCWYVTAELKLSGMLLVVKTRQLDSAALCWSSALLQHLASRFGQLCGKETAGGEGAGRK